MPDITMCPGTGCPLRETCFRYMAEPSEYMQSWANFTPLWGADNERLQPECPKHLPLETPNAGHEGRQKA